MLTLEKLQDFLNLINHNTKIIYDGEHAWIQCPFKHNKGKDKTPSMSVRLDKENFLFYCASCQQNGNGFNLLKNLGLDSSENKNKLKEIIDYGKFDINHKNFNVPIVQNIKKTEEQLLYDKLPYINDIGIKYIESEKKINHCELANFITIKQDIIADILYFPVYLNDKIYFLAKKQIYKPNKWIYPYGSHVKNVFFTLKKIKNNLPIFITEGIFDAITLSLNGYNAVSVFGCSIGDIQIERLSSYSNKKILFFDGDFQGQKGSEKALLKCKEHFDCGFIKCYENKDPNNLSKEELKELLGETNENI